MPGRSQRGRAGGRGLPGKLYSTHALTLLCTLILLESSRPLARVHPATATSNRPHRAARFLSSSRNQLRFAHPATEGVEIQRQCRLRPIRSSKDLSPEAFERVIRCLKVLRILSDPKSPTLRYRNRRKRPALRFRLIVASSTSSPQCRRLKCTTGSLPSSLVPDWNGVATQSAAPTASRGAVCSRIGPTPGSLSRFRQRVNSSSARPGGSNSEVSASNLTRSSSSVMRNSGSPLA